MIPTRLHSKGLLLLFITFLVLIGNAACYAQITDDIIYDTVWVYDTVWEYETVYDTIWEYETVYDTVEIESQYDPYALIEPITVSKLHFSSHYYKSKSYPKNVIVKPKTKVKRSAFSKLRYELKNNREQLRSKQWDNSSDMAMTLNPTKGSFDPRIFSKGIYSIEAYGGMAFQNTDYSLKNIESQAVNNSDSITELPSYEYGIRFNFNVFQFGVQTGVGVSQIRDQFSYTEITNHVDSTPFKEGNHYWTIETDSVWVLNLDSALVGTDYGEWHKYPRDTLIKDSLIVYDYDTARYHNSKSVINTISFIEIPLIFTYEMAFSRLGVQLKLGGINQIHTYSKGKLYNQANEVVDISDYNNYTKYNLALYGGVGMQFKLTYDISLVADAFYKHPLLKLSESNSAIVRRKSFGINAGIRYCF